MTKKQLVIGVIGPIGAGKDTSGRYLSEKMKIPVFQISSVLKSICHEKGINPTRDNLIKLGSELGKKFGDGYLAEFLHKNNKSDFVVTGLRQLGQIKYFRSHTNFTLITIDAEPSIRFRRALQNPKFGEAETLEEFNKREKAENSPPNMQRLFDCMRQADFKIKNESTEKNLHTQLDKIINKLEP